MRDPAQREHAALPDARGARRRGRAGGVLEARVETGAPRRPSDHLRGANDLNLPVLLPSDEPPAAPPYSALRAGEDYREHLRRTFARGTTPNGVFAAKLMWS